jgi:hypothetical protein
VRWRCCESNSESRDLSEHRSYGCRPGVLAHSRLGLVIVRLGATGAAEGRVGEVHVRRHGGWVCWIARLGVGEVIGRAWGGHATVRRRGPSETGHVWAPADTVRPVVIVGRRLEGLRGSIGVRRHRRTCMRCTAVTRERRGSGRGGSTRTALGKVASYMRGDGPVAHIIITSRAMHVQRWEFTTRGHGLSWRRG